MADPKDPATPPKDPATPPKNDGQGVTVEQVRTMITDVVKSITGQGGGTPKPEGDITAQVEAAVTKVHQGQAAAQVMADLQSRLAEVEKRPVVEKKPKEYRAVTRRWWGDDDDE